MYKYSSTDITPKKGENIKGTKFKGTNSILENIYPCNINMAKDMIRHNKVKLRMCGDGNNMVDKVASNN